MLFGDDFRLWGSMIAARIFAALALALTVTACALPQQKLSALLASQGVPSPWHVEQQQYGSPHVWLVYAWETPRQVAPDLCVAQVRPFEVKETEANYETKRWEIEGRIALRSCESIKPDSLPRLAVI